MNKKTAPLPPTKVCSKLKQCFSILLLHHFCLFNFSVLFELMFILISDEKYRKITQAKVMRNTVLNGLFFVFTIGLLNNNEVGMS